MLNPNWTELVARRRPIGPKGLRRFIGRAGTAPLQVSRAIGNGRSEAVQSGMNLRPRNAPMLLEPSASLHYLSWMVWGRPINRPCVTFDQFSKFCFHGSFGLLKGSYDLHQKRFSPFPTEFVKRHTMFLISTSRRLGGGGSISTEDASSARAQCLVAITMFIGANKRAIVNSCVRPVDQAAAC